MKKLQYIIMHLLAVCLWACKTRHVGLQQVDSVSYKTIEQHVTLQQNLVDTSRLLSRYYILADDSARYQAEIWVPPGANVTLTPSGGFTGPATRVRMSGSSARQYQSLNEVSLQQGQSSQHLLDSAAQTTQGQSTHLKNKQSQTARQFGPWPYVAGAVVLLLALFLLGKVSGKFF